MAFVITRTAVLPVSVLACAVVVILAPSATVATGLLLLSSGLALMAHLVGRNTVHPLVADRLPTIEVRPLRVTPAERPTVRPHSWPDSGFRNIGRGTKGG
jgi:hypothetical protein